MKKLGTVVAGIANAIFPNIDWANVSISTYVRWILAILTMINNVLIACGIQPFEIKEDMVYALVSAIMNIIVIILNTYKDNPTSKEAIVANALMKSLKSLDDGAEKDDRILIAKELAAGNITEIPQNNIEEPKETEAPETSETESSSQ